MRSASKRGRSEEGEPRSAAGSNGNDAGESGISGMAAPDSALRSAAWQVKKRGANTGNNPGKGKGVDTKSRDMDAKRYFDDKWLTGRESGGSGKMRLWLEKRPRPDDPG